jgi:hypothetical protein
VCLQETLCPLREAARLALRALESVARGLARPVLRQVWVQRVRS